MSKSSIAALALLIGASIPNAALAGDMVGKSYRKASGAYGVRLDLAQAQGLIVPFRVAFENPTAGRVCFDRVQVKGTGDGKQAFIFSMFMTSPTEISATPQNKTEAPALKTDFFWTALPQAGVRVDNVEIRSLDWSAASSQQVAIRFFFNPAGPGRAGCTPPPSDTFVFTGK